MARKSAEISAQGPGSAGFPPVLRLRRQSRVDRRNQRLRGKNFALNKNFKFEALFLRGKQLHGFCTEPARVIRIS